MRITGARVSDTPGRAPLFIEPPSAYGKATMHSCSMFKGRPGYHPRPPFQGHEHLRPAARHGANFVRGPERLPGAPRCTKRMIEDNDAIWLGIAGAGIAGGMGGMVISPSGKGIHRHHLLHGRPGVPRPPLRLRIAGQGHQSSSGRRPAAQARRYPHL